MPARISLCFALSASLLACPLAYAKTIHKPKPRAAESSWNPSVIQVTDKDNNGQVTVHPGDTLSVDLRVDPKSACQWCFLYSGMLDLEPIDATVLMIDLPDPDSSLAIQKAHPAHGYESFSLDVIGRVRPAPPQLVRFVYVPPDGPDLTPVKTWQIRVTIARRPAQGKR